ncbi:uncharacterized protein EV420DRAFT_1752828 [Desarmillaria tabescens]|uniref:Uncharacterized protein n=1 Tax=Armillaria tabescens TaxID=1929756 RepID=A0AA39MMQ8_ARMTA|nr:uncharacterized protein EV420DRAFT_1752828 [Desarmillaria tabescens]KAK0439952.1 hypothetical protein EV420DRAFT_1752828 [Desarmillaria tabescens]
MPVISSGSATPALECCIPKSLAPEKPDLQFFSTLLDTLRAPRVHTLSIRRLYNVPPFRLPPRIGAQMSNFRVGWNPVEFDLKSLPSSLLQSLHESRATTKESAAGRLSPPMFIIRSSLLCKGNPEACLRHTVDFSGFALEQDQLSSPSATSNGHAIISSAQPITIPEPISLLLRVNCQGFVRPPFQFQKYLTVSWNAVFSQKFPCAGVHILLCASPLTVGLTPGYHPGDGCARSSSTQSLKNEYISICSLTGLLWCLINDFDPVLGRGSVYHVLDLTLSPHLGDLCVTCKTKWFEGMPMVIKIRNALEEFRLQIAVPGKDNAQFWKESICGPD